MEFLMSYGWVLLVALVAIGTLAYFGVLNLQMFLPENCVFDASSGLFCEDFTADDVNDITLRIKNVLDKSVTILMVSVATGIEGVGKSSCSNLEGGLLSGGTSDNFIIGTDCDLEAGDRIRGTVNILYQRGGGLRHTATGTLTLLVQAAGGEELGPDESVCQLAEEGGLCEGLDFVFGEGYQDECCELGYCC